MKTYFLIIISLFLFLVRVTLSQTTSNITYDVTTSLNIQTGADVCATTININGTYSGGGTICSGPLPVTISSFISFVDKNNVRLSWQTEYEINNAGFRIERMDTKENKWKELWFVAGHGTVNEPHSYNFEDRKLGVSAYKYRLKQIDYNGSYEYFELESEVIIKAPGKFNLSQNYPNPSNPKSRIEYEIPVTGKVIIKVYDLLGKEAATLVNETKEGGYYITEFDGTNLATGVYFYHISAEGNGQKFIKTMKMVLLK